jgi:polyisoprenoid-binding protein YceI
MRAIRPLQTPPRPATVPTLLCAGILLLGATASELHAEPREYVLDPEHLAIAFLVDHAGFAKVLGQFARASGTFRFDEQTETLSNLEVVVETASVDTRHDRRDRHLRNRDFFDSGTHPRMTFTAESATPIDRRTFEVAGTLELLGQQRPLTLTATWNKSGPYPFDDRVHVLGLSARGSLKRSAFGMLYGVENGWVGDDVEILIEAEAHRK